MKKSMIETAYQILSANQDKMPFVALWTDVAKEMGYNESQFNDNIAQFYTDLSIDNRFLNFPGNVWDLKSRHTYSESVMDTDSIAIDEDSDDEEEILLDENEERNEKDDLEESE
jgi:DNA-directed RNA polymerase subunit delta